MRKSRRSKSSGRWLQEHFADPYVHKAQKLGYRARAAFKLLEIQEKDKIITPGMVVVDLGAAPGSWSQIAAKLVGDKGRVVALDILDIESLAGVEIIQGDFTTDEVYQQLLDTLAGQAVDVILSDMAPNMSGMNSVDQPRAMYLAELSLDFAKQTLKPGGTFLTKVFQGEGFDSYFKLMKSQFNNMYTRKPEASRSRSREVYLLGRGFKGVE